MIGPPDLSFKDLLQLLDKEHERSLQQLREENLRFRGFFCDVTEKDAVLPQGAGKLLAGEWDVLATEANATIMTLENDLPAEAIEQEPLAENGVTPHLRTHTLEETGSPSKTEERKHIKDAGSPVYLGFQLWPTWTDEKHVSSILPEAFLCSISEKLQAKANNMGRKSTNLHQLIRRCPRRWSDCVISPTSRTLMAWSILSVALLIYDFVWVPIQLGFESLGNGLTESIDFFVMIYWTLDILVNLLTAVHSEEGKLITEFRPIAARYLRGYFLMDVLIVVNDWLVLIYKSLPNGMGLFRVGKLVRILRLLRSLRLMRIVKIQHVLHSILALIDAEVIHICFDLSWKVVLVVSLNHIIACLWFAVGSTSNGWVRDLDVRGLDIHGVGEKYLISLHWALSSFTPAQKPPVRPITLPERMFAVCMILIAMVGMSTFLASITNQMTRLRQIKSTEMKQFFTLRRFLHENRISKDLSARLTRYIHIAKDIHKKRVPRSSVELLAYLSGPLNIELQTEIYSPCLTNHPFFDKYSEWSSSAMSHLVYAAVGKDYYSRGDTIFSFGTDSTYMCFLDSGTLFYLRPRGVRWNALLQNHEANKRRVIVVTTGQWFCEAVLWGPWVHRGTMGSLVESEVIKLSTSKFQQITQEHREVFENCRACANRFVSLLEENCQKYGCMWDIPPETILSEIHHDDAGYPENDPRLQQKRLQDVDLRKAEIYQAVMNVNLMDPDSEED